MHLIPSSIVYSYSFIIGAVFGSFLNVCIARIPEEKSVVRPRSRCPQCKEQISSYDNIPILSFIILGGKCRHCKNKISWLYPFVEFLSGIFAILCVWKFNFGPDAALWFFLFVCPLIVITFIDFEHYMIPDVVSLPFTVIGIGVHLAATSFQHPWLTIQDSALGMLLGAGGLWLIAKTYELIKKQEGLGLGDVKLMAMVGTFLGFKAVFFVFLFSSLFASIIGIFLMIFSRYRLNSALPYGPFIAMGALLHLFYGNELLRAYFHFAHSLLH